MQRLNRRSFARAVIACVGPAAVGCGESPADAPTEPEPPTLEQARAELRGYIENVAQATARRYHATDNRGNVMDGVKIIASAAAGGFIGVYHTFDGAIFNVHLATSTDLMNWTWRRQLASQASQPTLRPSAAGYVAAWEQEPDNHLKFAYYSNWTDLLNGVASKAFDAPRELSPCAEGTPNLYSASSSSIDVGFHFFWNCDVDRQARGTTDWTSWSSSREEQLDGAVLAHGVEGNVGDRDGTFSFRAYDFLLIEGQFVKGDFGSWVPSFTTIKQAKRIHCASKPVRGARHSPTRPSNTWTSTDKRRFS